MPKSKNNAIDTHQSATDGHQGQIFILSGPSGVGKTTLRRHVLSRYPEMIYSISHTTRHPRTGETAGIDYHFVNTEGFEKGIRQNQWAEWAQVHGNYYGTSADNINQVIRQGQNILLDIDVKGTRQIIRRYPQSITIFILPPSMDELRRRLGARGTDSPEVVEKRIRNAAKEIEQKEIYQHVITNAVLEEAIASLISIIEKNINRQ
jgi:guanylate kinase